MDINYQTNGKQKCYTELLSQADSFQKLIF